MNVKPQCIVNVLVRLCRQAHREGISLRDYSKITSSITYILGGVERGHGVDFHMRTLHATSDTLGQSIGPLEEEAVKKLIARGCLITRVIEPTQ
jgi:hypothetical protein